MTMRFLMGRETLFHDKKNYKRINESNFVIINYYCDIFVCINGFLFNNITINNIINFCY